MKSNTIGHRRTGREHIHVLSAVVAILAFAVVYIYADNPKLYYAVAAAALMAGAIYFANHLQLHHRDKGWIK